VRIDWALYMTYIKTCPAVPEYKRSNPSRANLIIAR